MNIWGKRDDTCMQQVRRHHPPQLLSPCILSGLIQNRCVIGHMGWRPCFQEPIRCLRSIWRAWTSESFGKMSVGLTVCIPLVAPIDLMNIKAIHLIAKMAAPLTRVGLTSIYKVTAMATSLTIGVTSETSLVQPLGTMICNSEHCSR